MSRIELKACGTALVTPFKNGEVDYDAYAQCIDRQVGAGVQFLVPLATTGETPTLTFDEKVQLLKITRAHAPHLPLLVGAGNNSLHATLSNMELLSSLGVDAFLIVVPYYNKPTQEGQFQYFKAVSEMSDKPVVIYNVPGRTGANMTAQTTVRLARECPNIIGIKEASGNWSQVSEILRSAPEDFAVLSGDDEMTFPFMACGAKGVVSVASNVAPAEVERMTEALLRGDIKTARELHFRLLPLFRNCFVESNPVPVKAAMEAAGMIGAEVRLPLSEATPATKQLMSQTLTELWQK